MNELQPLFADRETRIQALPEKARASFQSAYEGRGDDRDEWADRQFTSLWLSRHLGTTREKVDANFDALTQQYFGHSDASKAYDDISTQYATLGGKRVRKAAEKDAGFVDYAAGGAKLIQEGGAKGLLKKPQGLYALGDIGTRALNVTVQSDPETVSRLEQIKREIYELNQADPEVTEEKRMAGRLGRPAASSRDFMSLEQQLVEERKSGKDMFTARKEKLDALLAERSKLEGEWKGRMNESVLKDIEDEYERLSEKFREASDELEIEGIDPEVRESLFGTYAEGAGGMFQMLVSSPSGALMFAEIYAHVEDVERDSLKEQGIDFDRHEGAQERVMEAAVSTYVEKALGAERILGSLLKNAGKGVKDLTMREIIKRTGAKALQGAVGEASDEMVQGALSDIRRSIQYDPDYDMSAEEFIKRRGFEALIAGPLGALMGGGVAFTGGIQQRADAKKVLAKDGMAFNQHDWKQLQRLHSEEELRAMAPEGLEDTYVAAASGDAQAQEAYNEHVYENIPDEEVVGEAQDYSKLVRRGDKEYIVTKGASFEFDETIPSHQEMREYIESAEAVGGERVPVDLEAQPMHVFMVPEQFMGDAGNVLLPTKEGGVITPEEAQRRREAGLPSEVLMNRPPEIRAIDEGFAVLDERGNQLETPEPITNLSDAVEIARGYMEEQAMQAPAAVNDFLEYIQEQRPEIAAEYFPERMTAANMERHFPESAAQVRAAITAEGYSGNEAIDEFDRRQFLGMSQAGFEGGMWQQSIRIFKDGTPLTVVEEVAEDYLKARVHRFGDMTYDELREWRKNLEAQGIEDTVNDYSNSGMVEWWSDRAIEYVTGRVERENAEDYMEAIPNSFRGFLARLRVYATNLFKNAARLMDLRARGELPEGFERRMEEAIGQRARESDPRPRRNGGGRGITFQQTRNAEEGAFYSQLERTLSSKLQGKAASVQQVKGLLTPKHGVKPEEVKWSGIEQWIDANADAKGKVSTAELMEYVRDAGQVKFEEVTRRADSIVTEEERISKAIEEHAEDWGYEWEFNGSVGILYDDGEVRQEGEPWEVARNEGIEWEAGESDETQYSSYVLPNGENYREVVLTMPNKVQKKYRVAGEKAPDLGRFFDTLKEAEAFAKKIEASGERSIIEESDYQEKKSEYTSSHFSDIPNYVAHMRLNERTDSEGADGLFIEEIQSDRHQQGREKGYKGDVFVEIKEEELYGDKVFVVFKDGERHKTVRTKPEAVREAENIQSFGGRIPDAPFRKDWNLQMFKRALRDAVASGKDWIGWTTGETQAERYDLSKSVDSIGLTENQGGFILQGFKDGSEILTQRVATESEVEAYVGKDVARKLLEQEPEQYTGRRMLEGEDLKVGGEGMKGFYDNMLPKAVNKYVKKWGGKVERGTLEGEGAKTFEEFIAVDGYTLDTISDRMKGVRQNAYEEYLKEFGTTPIHRVQITDAMRENVEQGQATFQSTRTDTAAFKAWFGDSKVVDENGEPLVVYHGTHAADFDQFGSLPYFSSSPFEAEGYAQAFDAHRLLNPKGKIVRVDGSELVGKRITSIGILQDAVVGEIVATDYHPVARKLKDGTIEVFDGVNTDSDKSYDLKTRTVEVESGASEYDSEFDIEHEEYLEYLAKALQGNKQPRPRTYPVYLSIKNPKKMDMLAGNRFSKKTAMGEDQLKVIEDLKAQGYDGIVTPSDQGFYAEAAAFGATEWMNYIPFEPTQIKSATGNVGTFDPTDPRITHQMVNRTFDASETWRVDNKLQEEMLSLGFVEDMSGVSSSSWGSQYSSWFASEEKREEYEETGDYGYEGVDYVRVRIATHDSQLSGKLNHPRPDFDIRTPKDYMDTVNELAHLVDKEPVYKEGDLPEFGDADTFQQISMEEGEGGADRVNFLAAEEQALIDQQDKHWDALLNDERKRQQEIGETLELEFTGRQDSAAGFMRRNLMSMGSRLRNVHLELFSRTREYRLNTHQTKEAYADRTRHARKLYEQLPKPERERLALALANRDMDAVKEIAGQVDGLLSEIQRVQTVLEELRRYAIGVGFEVNELSDYWPRHLNDRDGLLSALGLDNKGHVAEALLKAQNDAKAKGKTLNDEQRTMIVSQVLTGSLRGSGKPANFKGRKIDTLDMGQYLEFYASPFEALDIYINRVVDAVEQRKFFGKAFREESIEYPDVTEEGVDEAGNVTVKQGKGKVRHRIDLDSSISAMVLKLVEKGELNAEEQLEAEAVLQSMHSTELTPKWAQIIRTLGYMSTMPKFSVAAVQLEDITSAIFAGGTKNTVKSFAAYFDKSEMSLVRDFGMEAFSQDYADATMSMTKVLDKLITISGVKFLGRGGAAVQVNAGLKRYRQAAEQGRFSLHQERRLHEYFGGDAARILKLKQDLAAGKKTDDVTLLGWNILLDFQPLDVSEMPEGYARHPVGRVFYMLKTFMLKRLDIYRREGIRDVKIGYEQGNYTLFMGGMRRLLALYMLYWLGGATVNFIRDYLGGKKPVISDVVMDSSLTAIGFSRYTFYYAKQNGATQAAIQYVMFPAPWLDYPIRDVISSVRKDDWDIGDADTFRIFPLGGNLWYWYFGGGAAKQERESEKARKKATKNRGF